MVVGARLVLETVIGLLPCMLKVLPLSVNVDRACLRPVMVTLALVRLALTVDVVAVADIS